MYSIFGVLNNATDALEPYWTPSYVFPKDRTALYALYFVCPLLFLYVVIQVTICCIVVSESCSRECDVDSSDSSCEPIREERPYRLPFWRLLLSDLRLYGFRAITSMLYRISCTTYDTEHIVSCVRSQFKRWEATIPKPDIKCNPHEPEAAARGHASRLIDKIIFSLGIANGYDIQTNEHVGPDGRHVAGSSVIYDPVDIHQRTTGDISMANYLTMTDVDYYIDLHFYMSFNKPIFINTQQPEAPTRVKGHSTFYYEDDNMVFQSHGGFSCRHQIWDYSPDYVQYQYRFYTGWFRVLRYSLAYGKSVIVLIPMSSLPWWAYPLSWLAKRAVLRRFRFNHFGDGCWTAYKIFDQDNLKICVSNSGPHSFSTVLPYAKFCQLCDWYQALQASPIPLSHIHRVTGTDSPVLARFIPDLVKHQFCLDTVHRGVGITVDESIDSTCPCDAHIPVEKRVPGADLAIKIGPHALKEPKAPCIPVVAPALAPEDGNAVGSFVRDKPAFDAAVLGRIIKPQAEAVARFDDRVRESFPAFVSYISLIVGALDPLPWEAVEPRLFPDYRSKMRAAFDAPITVERTERFIKGETYDKTTDPRMITPLPPNIQAKMYPFTYALQDALHKAPWFAFGRPLPKVAEYIASISSLHCSDGFVAVETDFSRFDGTITQGMRDLEVLIYRQCFPLYADTIGDLVKLTHHLKGKDRACNDADSGFSRSSGAPDTCLMNSILNLFTLFLTGGPQLVDNNCVVGGDDGLAFMPTDLAKRHEANASACGFKIKIKINLPPLPFSFLARVFTWGSPNSICDAKRLLSKMHILNHSGVPKQYRLLRLAMKLESLLQTEKNTPIVGPYLMSRLDDITKKMRNDTPEARSLMRRFSDSRFWDQTLENGGWPNLYEPWMSEVVQSILQVVEVPAAASERKRLAIIRPSHEE